MQTPRQLVSGGGFANIFKSNTAFPLLRISFIKQFFESFFDYCFLSCVFFIDNKNRMRGNVFCKYEYYYCKPNRKNVLLRNDAFTQSGYNYPFSSSLENYDTACVV